MRIAVTGSSKLAGSIVEAFNATSIRIEQDINYNDFISLSIALTLVLSSVIFYIIGSPRGDMMTVSLSLMYRQGLVSLISQRATYMEHRRQRLII